MFSCLGLVFVVSLPYFCSALSRVVLFLCCRVACFCLVLSFVLFSSYLIFVLSYFCLVTCLCLVLWLVFVLSYYCLVFSYLVLSYSKYTFCYRTQWPNFDFSSLDNNIVIDKCGQGILNVHLSPSVRAAQERTALFTINGLFVLHPSYF